MRARGRAGQGRGRSAGSPADPRSPPHGALPGPCVPSCPEGSRHSVPGSAQLRLPLRGKPGTRTPPSGLLRQGRGALPDPRRTQTRRTAPQEWRGGKGSGDGSRPAEMWRATRSSRVGAVGIRPLPSGRLWTPSRPLAPLKAERAAAPPGAAPARPVGPRRLRAKRGPAAPSGGGEAEKDPPDGAGTGAGTGARPPSRPRLLPAGLRASERRESCCGANVSAVTLWSDPAGLALAGQR